MPSTTSRRKSRHADPQPIQQLVRRVGLSFPCRRARPGLRNRPGNRDYVLEYPIQADYALIKAERADRWGNLVYRKSARNFGPIMAAAAKCTVVQVRETVELGALDPEAIVTPGIFVKRIVLVAVPVRKAA